MQKVVVRVLALPRRKLCLYAGEPGVWCVIPVSARLNVLKGLDGTDHIINIIIILIVPFIGPFGWVHIII